MLTLVRVVVTVAMLGIVPLGLGLVGGRGVEALRRVWLGPAFVAAAAQWLPRGAFTAALAVPYLALTAALAAVALTRAWTYVAARPLAPYAPQNAGLGSVSRQRTVGAGQRWVVEVAVWTALATPVVGALALVAERAGVRLFGFRLSILALTVAHFHVAGFAAALVAGLVARATAAGALGTTAALCVPGGTLLVLLGFFVGDEVELAGAAVLTAGMWAAGWLTWRDVRPHSPDRVTRGLLAVSSAVLAATMVLALSWALGEATGLPHLSITWMAATHGVTNALGFALCAVLAWRRLGARPL
ncbi:YndJ family protein [Kineosporia sp. A_224]|uniref:YndJ family protein n=1 Tax=Kineosporia sp. A_224 TaxID=1962180 RepID=UPI000B4C0E40|nr:YndJ family protein [Kineosporia sp. A_224]